VHLWLVKTELARVGIHHILVFVLVNVVDIWSLGPILSNIWLCLGVSAIGYVESGRRRRRGRRRRKGGMRIQGEHLEGRRFFVRDNIIAKEGGSVAGEPRRSVHCAAVGCCDCDCGL
jgi:hypothetical protein